MTSIGPRRLFGFLLLSAVLVGCGGEATPPPADPAAAAPAPAPTDAGAAKKPNPVGALSPIVPKK